MTILAVALMTQLAGTVLTGLPRFDPKSALISGLSLCLLLRTNEPGLAVLAAVVAVASKFVLRVRGKHVFNPTNFALVADDARHRPGLGLARAMGERGGLRVPAGLGGGAGGESGGARRRDVDLPRGLRCCCSFGRSLWLGDPLVIPLHRLENGALVLFAFFMISDPRTTPDSRAGRILFAVLVAVGAYVVQFKLFRTNGLLWSLAVCSLVVPLIDRLLPGPRYQWRPARDRRLPTRGPCDEAVRRRHDRCRSPLALAAPSVALAFCGFYVAKADAKLFNQRLAGGAGPRRRQDRAHHGQRLQGRAEGVRDRRARCRRCSSAGRSTWATAR